LHTASAVKDYENGLSDIKNHGGKILTGGRILTELPGYYVTPTVVEIDSKSEILKQELFVPILYVMKFENFEEAVEVNNNVPQGLSSAIFTKNMQNVFRWIGPNGSDCGLCNVNVSTSGDEIGGGFGGEKETGGGRESGGEAWRQ